MGFLKRSSSNKEDPAPPPPTTEAQVEEGALTDEDSSYGPVPPPPPGTDLVHEKQAEYDLEKQASNTMAASTEDEEEDDDDDEDEDIDMPDKHDPPSQDATLELSADDRDFLANGDGDEDDDQSVEIPPTSIVQRMIDTENEEYMEKESSSGRFCQLGMIIACCLVVLAIVMGVGFGTGAFTKESKNTVAPPTNEDGTTTDPTDGATDGGAEDTTDREIPDMEGDAPAGRQEDLLLYLASISAVPMNLDQAGTAEAAAADWLINQDPLQLGIETLGDQFRLSQRYALLSLWFSDAEVGAWDNIEGWLQAEDECTWFGVTCSEQDIGGETANVVTQLQMVDNNLKPGLPADLVLLEYLTTLK